MDTPAEFTEPRFRAETLAMTGKARPTLPFVATLVLIAWLSAVALDAAFGGPAQGILVAITEVAAVAFIIWRGVRFERDRQAWLLIGVAFALWVVGDWIRIVLHGTEARDWPSVPDVIYTLFYVVLYAGAGELMRGRAPKFRTSIWLDGAIVMATVVAIAAIAFVGPLTGDAKTAVADVIYPIGDFVLAVMIVIAIGLSGWKPGRQWIVLVGGVLLFCVGDAWYAIESVNGATADNVWRGTVIAFAFVLFAVGSALRPGTAEVRFDGLRALAAPMACAAAAVALLVAAQVTSIPSIATVLAGVAMLLVIVRCVFTFRENLGLLETREQAVTDELTGLANRRQLLLSLEQALASETRAGLLIVDLDRFKELNDTLGHQVGDRLLNAFAGRLTVAAGDAKLVARLGGDEFAVLLTGDDVDEVALSAAAGAALAALAVPFGVDGLQLHLGASIGGALHPDHAREPFGLMRRADVAMYTAKRGGGGYECYRPEADEGSRERLELAQDLRGAAAAGQFVLHYQPKANLPGGTIDGVEALIRWNHPERGMVPPDAFLSIAEETGMMRDLTLWVIDEALRQMAEWDDEGLTLTVAVNLAMTNLLDVRLPDDVSRLLDGSGTDADRLVLEINENVVMADERRILAVLEDLRSLGIKLSLDDFGAGHTSFAYLKRLPIQELKIDRSFVMEVDKNSDDAAIVRASAQLGRDLGLRVVAEGVETPEGLAVLETAGVDIAQGYLLSKPLPASDLATWVRTRQAAGGGERTLDPHVA